MKILLVEDDVDFGARLEARLSSDTMGASVVRAMSKSTALESVAKDFFDLIILDLGIPPSPEESETSTAHGMALFDQFQDLLPGTPIYILTGAQETRFSRQLASKGNQERLWGSVKSFESVSYFAKEEVVDLLERVKLVTEASKAAQDIVVNTRGKDLNLSPEYKRALQSYAKKSDAVMCDVTALKGGLSDTNVYKAVARSNSGHPESICAAKLGDRKKIAVERIAYDRYVTKLGVGHCPAIFYNIDNALGPVSGIFYTLADENFISFFDFLNDDPKLGKEVVLNTRSALERWFAAAELKETSIGEIIERIISPSKLALVVSKFSLDWLADLSKKKVYANRSCIHGDLHCGNILVKPNADVAIIDFDDVGLGHSAADPINLEMSLIFHPQAVKLGLSAPLQSVAESWPDLDGFISDQPLRATISACRTWLHDIAGSDDAAFAAALAFAIRQLRYDTVDPSITLTLINSIRSKL